MPTVKGTKSTVLPSFFKQKDGLLRFFRKPQLYINKRACYSDNKLSPLNVLTMEKS